MEIIKQTKDYTIFKKRNGRHAIKSKAKTWIRGEEKVEILLREGLIKLTEPKPAEEEPAAEESAADEAPAEAGEGE